MANNYVTYEFHRNRNFTSFQVYKAQTGERGPSIAYLVDSSVPGAPLKTWETKVFDLQGDLLASILWVPQGIHQIDRPRVHFPGEGWMNQWLPPLEYRPDIRKMTLNGLVYYWLPHGLGFVLRTSVDGRTQDLVRTEGDATRVKFKILEHLATPFMLEHCVVAMVLLYRNQLGNNID
ncbi:hypothetical protein JAAARDRAFT_43277 [Jaapia argillacea MUCL 33604]|uniref:Uncharacterized protein n=1 Tax=Jaapia argillacea MUCL 33604 TaxID=933084 RepID=A0A067QAI1_9AGAM|nr:hypothetical protein JAAARDRAFT_43277 [Jaapia argillacea MUCL 33604]